ncbi:MAG: hypothetical protein MST01_12085 [Prevotella sp.]|nr:hypothetical protein [Prevotella sp.]
MKTLKRILLCLLLLIPLNVVAGTEIKIKDTYPDIGPRTSVPSVDATLYSDYILLDINRYYGSVVVEVDFTFDISDMPVGAYNIRIVLVTG